MAMRQSYLKTPRRARGTPQLLGGFLATISCPFLSLNGTRWPRESSLDGCGNALKRPAAPCRTRSAPPRQGAYKEGTGAAALCPCRLFLSPLSPSRGCCRSLALPGGRVALPLLPAVCGGSIAHPLGSLPRQGRRPRRYTRSSGLHLALCGCCSLLGRLAMSCSGLLRQGQRTPCAPCQPAPQGGCVGPPYCPVHTVSRCVWTTRVRQAGPSTRGWCHQGALAAAAVAQPGASRRPAPCRGDAGRSPAHGGPRHGPPRP